MTNTALTQNSPSFCLFFLLMSVLTGCQGLDELSDSLLPPYPIPAPPAPPVH